MLALGAEFNETAGDFWSMVHPQLGPMPGAADADIRGAERRANPYAIKASMVVELGGKGKRQENRGYPRL
jgi:hypothetical protein